MTEKRFRSHIDECGVYYYIYDKKKILAEAFYKDDAEEIVDLLNAFHNENEQLKEIFKTMIKQLEIEIDSNETIYRGTFVFNSESFMILKKICEE